MPAPFTLAYSGATDQAYGVAGMALALVAGDAIHLFGGVDLDAPAGANLIPGGWETVTANPHMAAKAVWNRQLRDFRAICTMLLGNVACRRRLSGMQWPDATLSRGISEVIRPLGAEMCALEDDECDAVFESAHAMVSRMFAHPQVCRAMRALSETMERRRRMSTDEIVEYLTAQGLG